MKFNHIIAVALMLVGMNIFTYATTRYWTTKHVLTNAEDRMRSALSQNGLFEEVYSSEPVHIQLVIPTSGGMYYWWNNAVPYWCIGFIFMASSMATLRYKSKKSG